MTAITAEEQILQKYRAQNEAMTDADIDRLDTLLDDRYVAVHIDGYRQPKHERLKQMTTGQMRYHSITEQTAAAGWKAISSHATIDKENR